MKKKITGNIPMTVHLWLDFVMFAVIILGSLWLLQVIFLNTFYEGMKQGEIEKVGDRMVELYTTDRDEFENYWSRQEFRGGIFASILTADGMVIRSPQPMEEFQHQRFRGVPPDRAIENFDPDIWHRFIRKVESAGDGTTTYVTENKRGFASVIYGAALGVEDGEELYLYISSPLQPIDATRRVLQNQLIIVTVLSLVVSFILAYYIARRFSRPIMHIGEASSQLAEGNYDVHFEGGSYREVTELAEVLNTTARQLNKTDELRRDLMANVSHDLKTPLTIISSYGEMIRDISGDHKEKRDAHVSVIIDEAKRLSLLVNDILTLSGLEAGITTSEHSVFSLTDAVGAVVSKFRAFENDGYSFRTDIAEGVYIKGDEMQILQVIYNLITNAINYGGKEKYVSVSLTVSEGKARFGVEDRGEGIDKEELPFVWDRYYRSGKSHTRSVAGTGIGLSIAKRVLDVHGADYGVDSVYGEGAVFWFELPILNNSR